MAEEKVGVVTHFYTALNVGTVKLSGPVKMGDTLHFKGSSTDFTQSVTSMQLEHKAVTEAEAGNEVGIEVTEKVREGDEVFLIS